jgi:hypothetical protein
MMMPEPLNLNDWNKLNGFYKTSNEFLNVAKTGSKAFSAFSDLAPMLADLGPEMAFAGAAISLGVELFGGKTPA